MNILLSGRSKTCRQLYTPRIVAIAGSVRPYTPSKAERWRDTGYDWPEATNQKGKVQNPEVYRKLDIAKLGWSGALERPRKTAVPDFAFKNFQGRQDSVSNGHTPPSGR